MYKYERTNERKKLLELILGEKYFYLYRNRRCLCMTFYLLFLIFMLWTFLLIYDMLVQQQQLFSYVLTSNKRQTHNKTQIKCLLIDVVV